MKTLTRQDERSSYRERDRFLAIELLRFLLALIVVFYHYFFFGPLTHQIPLPVVSFPGLSLGIFAVAAFFIISGFVITISAAKKNALTFATARFVRLGPVLLLCSTITFVTMHGGSWGVSHGVSVRNYLRSIFVLPLVRFGGIDPSLWSLTIEIRFYIIVAVLLLFLRVEKHILSFCSAMLLFDCICLLAGDFSPFREYLPFFIIGTLLYVLVYERHYSVYACMLLLVSLALSCIRSFHEYNRTLQWVNLPSVSWWYGPVIAIGVLGIVLVFMTSGSMLKLNKSVKILGAMSYPLYVVHQLFGYWMTGLLVRHVKTMSIDPRWIVILLVIAISFLVAQFAEPPIARLYRAAAVRLEYRIAAAITHIRNRVMESV